ncbi:MAG: hypothetical protein JXR60_02135 [Bacteroidales bacterium]|nr:hypothetical protein [Bacteroidales bacterium]
MKTIHFLIVISVIALTFSACKKTDEDKAGREAAEQTIQDDGNAESMFDNIFKIVGDEVQNAESSGSKSTYNRDTETGCPQIDVTISNGIVTSLIIDYGDTYCTPTNSTDQFKGRIVVTSNGRFRESGTVITTSLEDFYINDYHIEGSKVLTNLGRDNDSLLNYHFEVIGARITAPSGEYTSWESDQNRRWLVGESSILWPFDDIWEISGENTGVDAEGNAYSIATNEPLWVKVGCRFIQQGTLTVQTQGFTVNVDYGTYEPNVCDRNVTYTVNDNNYTVTVN